MALQYGSMADGGIASMSLVINSLKDHYDITVLTNKIDSKISRFQDVEVKIIPLYNKWPYKLLSVISYSWYIIRSNYSVIHFNDIDAAWLGILSARLRKIPTILSIRGLKQPHEKYGVKWKVIKYIDRIHALSEEMKTELIDRLPVANLNSRIVSIYNFIANIEERDHEERRIKDKTINIGLIATFRRLKNQFDVLRKLVPFLQEEGLNFKMHFIGDFDIKEKYAKKCYDFVNENRLNSLVTFHGFKGDLEEIYRNIDVVIIASDREGLSRSMIESLSFGIPVVSFNVCSANEIITKNSCGLVVDRYAYQKMAKSIIEIVSTEERYAFYSSNAINAISRSFNRKILKKNYLELYNGVRK